MGMTLKLTQNVAKTFMSWKAQVLHDLHESVPYLYDNTVGDGPYNAWLDPILTDEWQLMGWNNVSEMTKFGMPGVFTHGIPNLVISETLFQPINCHSSVRIGSSHAL